MATASAHRCVEYASVPCSFHVRTISACFAGDQVFNSRASSGDYFKVAMETTPANSYIAMIDFSWDGVALNKMAQAKSCNPIRIGNRNLPGGQVSHGGYVVIAHFTDGRREDKQRACRRIAQFATQTILGSLCDLAHTGTLIEWPWGTMEHRRQGSLIRIVPRVVGHPVDGKDAKYNSNVLGQSGRCFVCQRRHGQPALKVNALCNASVRTKFCAVTIRGTLSSRSATPTSCLPLGLWACLPSYSIILSTTNSQPN